MHSTNTHLAMGFRGEHSRKKFTFTRLFNFSCNIRLTTTSRKIVFSLESITNKLVKYIRFLSTDSEMSPDLQSICGNGKHFLATTVPKMIFLTPHYQSRARQILKQWMGEQQRRYSPLLWERQTFPSWQTLFWALNKTKTLHLIILLAATFPCSLPCSLPCSTYYSILMY